MSAGAVSTVPLREARRLRIAGGALLVPAAILHVTALTGATAARAEYSEDQYRSPSTIDSASERARVEAQVESERRRAAVEAARRAAEEQAQRAREEALRAQRPIGEVLTELRCSACHTLAVTDQVRHGALGWRLVVERMRWLHGARLAPGEAARITAYLHERSGGDRLLTAAEWLTAAAAIIGAAAAMASWRLRRRRRNVFLSCHRRAARRHFRAPTVGGCAAAGSSHASGTE
jgi:hypothetical protein